MSSWTLRYLSPWSTLLINSMCYLFKMCGIHATRDATRVVQFQALYNDSACFNEGNTMCVEKLTLPFEISVTAFPNGPCP
jgi:hypothetical protein